MRGIPHLALLIVALLVAGGPYARAGELLPADRPLPEVIDTYLDAKLSGEGVKPVGDSDDAGLIRRLTLDLVGRIPTEAEVRDFIESTHPDKRFALVDRLMASPAYARHQANELDAMLMAG